MTRQPVLLTLIIAELLKMKDNGGKSEMLEGQSRPKHEASSAQICLSISWPYRVSMRHYIFDSALTMAGAKLVTALI